MAYVSAAEIRATVHRLAAENGKSLEEADWIFTDVLLNAVNYKDKPIEGWAPVPALSLGEHSSESYIYRTELKNAAAAYLNNEWLSDKKIDWVLANTLIYAELSATTHHMGMGRYFHKGEISKGLVATKIAWVIAKWALALAILAALVILLPGWLAAVWGALIVWRQIAIARHKSRINTLLQAMGDAYGAASSINLSWAIVWDALVKSRDLGAVWDPELYRLVELRKGR